MSTLDELRKAFVNDKEHYNLGLLEYIKSVDKAKNNLD